MLLKSHRLSRQNFLNVKSQSKPSRFSTFTLYPLPNNRGFNRYSFVISKQQVKSAVERNRFRRRLYSLVSPLSGHHDIIIYPQASFFSLSDDQIISTLNSALSKISLSRS